MSLVWTLASRNLFQDRLRFAATVVGIVFSIVLVIVQLGLYLGFGSMVTTMIDHSPADLWVLAKGTKSFEDPSLLDARDGERLSAVDGVAQASPVLVSFAEWRLPNGDTTPILVVGSELKPGDLVPWNVTGGSVQALNEPGGVAVDRTYFGRLGVTGLGSAAKIHDQQVKVAAVTSGIRSFTTTPFVFAKLDRAHRYTGVPASKASHFLLPLKPGADPEQVRARIKSAVPSVEVLTTAQFRDRSRSFWLFGTGAGAALFGGALLGVIVGTVIVAQTLYSSTKDHLYEFATLRAIGCSKGYIYRVIAGQALINAVVGFVIAACIGFGVVAFTANSALPVVLNAPLLMFLFALTILMCVVSAIASIARVVRIDPVMVMAR